MGRKISAIVDGNRQLTWGWFLNGFLNFEVRERWSVIEKSLIFMKTFINFNFFWKICFFPRETFHWDASKLFCLQSNFQLNFSTKRFQVYINPKQFQSHLKKSTKISLIFISENISQSSISGIQLRNSLFNMRASALKHQKYFHTSVESGEKRKFSNFSFWMNFSRHIFLDCYLIWRFTRWNGLHNSQMSHFPIIKLEMFAKIINFQNFPFFHFKVCFNFPLGFSFVFFQLSLNSTIINFSMLFH